MRWTIPIIEAPRVYGQLQSKPAEEEQIQANADFLISLYEEDSFTDEWFAQNDSSTLTNINDTVSLWEENKETADHTDIQTMVLTENMSVFGQEENVSVGVHISEMANEYHGTNQIFVDSLVS